MCGLGDLKKFELIEKWFDKYNKCNYRNVKIWFVNEENGMRQWLNDQTKDGDFLEIISYDDLKNKIQIKLKKMGYTVVNVIPEGMSISCA